MVELSWVVSRAPAGSARIMRMVPSVVGGAEEEVAEAAVCAEVAEAAGPLRFTGVVAVSVTAPGGRALSPTRVAAMTMVGFTD